MSDTWVRAGAGACMSLESIKKLRNSAAEDAAEDACKPERVDSDSENPPRKRWRRYDSDSENENAGMYYDEEGNTYTEMEFSRAWHT